MKYGHIFLVLIILLYATTIFGADYNNNEYGIQFVLPENWKVIDYKELSVQKQKLVDGRYHPHKTLSICGYKGQDGNDQVNVFILFRNFDSTNFKEAKSYIRTEHAKDVMISSLERAAENAIGKEIKKYHKVRQEHRLGQSGKYFYGIAYYERDNKKLTVVVAKLLCRKGWITLRGFSKELEAEDFVSTVDNVISSFKYLGSTDTQITTTDELSSKTTGGSEENVIAPEKAINRFWKWNSVVVAVLVVFGLLRAILFRD